MATLDFKGKPFVYTHHLSVPFRPLEIDKKKSLSSKSKETSLNDNLIIHGDNLEGLKALLPQYSGKINLIYIDPPYNTGNEGWAYNDNVNSPLMKTWFKKIIDKEDLERHDKWLCMMFPRLQLLRDLLNESGVIFISIDENEFANLKLISDEIFGESNFIIDIIWNSRKSVSSDAIVSLNHNHTLVYSKNIELLRNQIKIHGLFKLPAQEEKFSNPDNDPRGTWTADPFDAAGIRKNLSYEIKNPNTSQLFSPPEGRHWAVTETQYFTLLEDSRIIFGKNGTGKPQKKRFFSEALEKGLTPKSIWDDVGTTTDGTRELETIFGEKLFDNPKPLSLIKKIIELATDKNSLVLDSFAGSGTTAHAVLDANHEDGGNRKFILIECEDYADTITAERIRRVIKGVPSAKDSDLKKGLGGSFTYCTLGEPIELEGLLKGKNLPDYENLAKYVFFNATGETLEKVAKPNKEYFIGESPNYRVHLLYQPDIQFLRSNDSGLNEELAQKIYEKGLKDKKKNLVFAPTKFLGSKELQNYHIEFCQLPFGIYRILG